jgi:hypothetical protein
LEPGCEAERIAMMFRKAVILKIISIFILGMIASGVSYAQKGTGVDLVIAGAANGSQAPELNSCLGEQTLTLEQIKEIVGPHNVCGVQCGGIQIPKVNCTIMCGDAAGCLWGQCIYM